MDTPQAPAAPDPAATAAAQAQSNKETAITQYGLNATNQVTPQGSLTYNQIGTWSDGTPRYEAVQSYSPSQQALYDKYTTTQSNLGDLGNTLSSQLKDYMATPFDSTGASKATADNLASLGTARLDPQFAKEQAALQTQLTNQGVRQGSEAWNNAMTQFSQQKNDAYNQLYLNGQQQAYNQAVQTRNQPINEITALLSGSQVSNPNYTSTPTPGVAATDVIGAQQQSLNQQNVGYQAQVAQNNALMSGLFGLGKSALGGWAMSDIRLKHNIDVVSRRDDGLQVIDFDYSRGSGLPEGRQRGLIAQQVRRLYPAAVARVGRYYAVNYDMVPGWSNG